MNRRELAEHARRMAAKGAPGAAEALAALTSEAPAVAGRSTVRIKVAELTIDGLDRVTVERAIDYATIAGVGTRRNETLTLTLPFPPRTKKNGGKGGFMGIKQRPAYVKFRDAVIRHLRDVKELLGLPLPAREYNCAALFYVDKRGETADRIGLEQGLYDALENAGVVTNDWQFRTGDGTRVITGDPSPRVELTITPL